MHRINKKNSEKLADFLMTEEGLELIRLLQTNNIILSSSSDEDSKNYCKELYSNILYWEPKVKANKLIYERPNEDLKTSYNECQPKIIHPNPNPNTIRICLVGESMASGVFLKPSYTPSVILKAALDNHISNQELEVLDFSQPNIGPSDQLEIVSSLHQLNPHIILLLTGNNWYYGLSMEPTLSSTERVEIGNYVEDNNGNILSLASRFRNLLTERTETVFNKIYNDTRKNNIKLIVALPPQNHLWDRRDPVPFLGENKSSEWHNIFERSKKLLGKGDYIGALKESDKIDKLDRGLVGISNTIKRDCYLNLGYKFAAYKAAQKVINASNWNNFSWALPALPTYASKTLSNLCKKKNIKCINIENIFIQETKSPIIGYEMFYDHCHLSDKGIAVAMNYIAIVISNIIEKNHNRDYFPDSPSSEVAGLALIRAAIWNNAFAARLNDSNQSSVIKELLYNSLKVIPNFNKFMWEYSKTKTLLCEPQLSSSFKDIINEYPKLSNAEFLRIKRLDGELIKNIFDTLGIDDSKMNEFIEPHIRMLEEGIDVSSPLYKERFWERTSVSSYDKNQQHSFPYYKSYWNDSKFSFVCDGGMEIILNIEARLNNLFLYKEAKCKLYINGIYYTSFSIRKDWKVITLVIKKSSLLKGVNSILIEWPPLKIDEERAITNVVTQLKQGVAVDLFPIFGEIHKMIVKTLKEE